MNNVKFENGKLIVPTKKGNIVVIVDLDDCAEGIFVEFESNDIKEKYAYTLPTEDLSKTIPLIEVKYDSESKSLGAKLWEDLSSNECTYTADYTDALMFDEDFDILEDGTKVIYAGKVAYITGNDSEDCENGYHECLNYYIKYSSKDETYEEVQDRIDANNEKHYDDMALWYHISEYKPMNLDFKERLYRDDIVDSIKTKLLESYSMEQISKMDDERLTKWLFETLCFSHSSSIVDFIHDNEVYFKSYLSEYNDIDMFATKVISFDGHRPPFNEEEPKEFFDILSDYIQYIIKNI